MNILSVIGYNTQSNLKTAAGCGTEREQRHSTGGYSNGKKLWVWKQEQQKFNKQILWKWDEFSGLQEFLHKKQQQKQES